MNTQKNKQRNKNGGKGIKIFFCVGGAVLVGICLFCRGLVKFTKQHDTQTAIKSNSSKGCDEIHHNGTTPGVQDNDSSTADNVTVNTSSWNLVLVNRWNALRQDFSVELTQLKNGHAIDKRAYPDLQDMMNNMRAEGLQPLICSSYRTNLKQQKLYNKQVNEYLAKGYSQAKAEEEAGKWVAIPGTSEHQTGLALDIVDTSYQILDKKQENTAVQQWLMYHSWEYGFILRYPSGKSHITGIDYEPWHYRYVGKEAAKEIYEKQICLEEYLEELNNG